jgi:N-acetylglucosaminyldiphosphoundecaprenol N-acetyl-beta-D-mannosaminyltransferase
MALKKKRYRIAGVRVDALSVCDLNQLVENSVAKGSKKIIANHNLHSIYLYHRIPKMRALYRKATHIHIDGMSIVYLGRLLGFPLERRHRVTYVDWVNPLLQLASNEEWRLFYLGAKPEVVRTGAKRIRREYSGIELGCHHGYFDPGPESNENQEVVQAINDFDPDILMVGMGMPRQEKWINDNIDQICANVVLPSGACIDYIAGSVPTPPRWMGQMGLEWLYRFLQEPARLWHRNLVEPWPVLFRFLKDFIHYRMKGADAARR